MDSLILRAKQVKPAVYLLVAAVVILLLMPQIGTPFVVFLSTEALILGILALSLNLLMGYLGLASLGHAAFFGLGGYTVAILLSRTEIESFVFFIAAAVIVTAIFSMAVSFVLVRTTGFYFLMITLAVGQMLWGIAYGWYGLTRGSRGMFGFLPPNLGLPWSGGDLSNFYYLVLAFFAASAFLMYLITISPYGRVLVGIREDEIRMRALGYNTWRYKYSCIVISGVFGGLAGALKVYQDGFITPSYFGFVLSATVMLMVLLGGRQSFVGPIVGAFAIEFLRQFISTYTEYWNSVLGVLFIAIVVFAPRGIVGLIVEKWELRNRVRLIVERWEVRNRVRARD